jgi:hypothetical protein
MWSAVARATTVQQPHVVDVTGWVGLFLAALALYAALAALLQGVSKKPSCRWGGSGGDGWPLRGASRSRSWTSPTNPAFGSSSSCKCNCSFLHWSSEPAVLRPRPAEPRSGCP